MFNVPQELVEELEAFQFKFVRDEMAKGYDEFDTFENIYLRHLGTFHASEGMIRHIKRSKDKKNGSREDNTKGS